MFKGAPWLPAVIYRPCPIEMQRDGGDWQWVDRWPILEALRDADVFGRPKDLCDPYWVWLNGREISHSEFVYWLETRRHIKLYEPDAPDADPTKKIDLNKMRPIGPPGM